MSLPPGTRLGVYEITAAIGAGGMGEVYRATDTKLNRDVAIKVLLGGVAHDAERRERFEREAQAIAALNHPNIVTIFGIDRLRPVRSASPRDAEHVASDSLEPGAPGVGPRRREGSGVHASVLSGRRNV